MKTKLIMLAALAGSLTAAATPAAAVEEVFANITYGGSARNFRWVRTAGGGGTFYTTSTGTATAAGATIVTFSLVGSPVPLSVSANFLLSGTTAADPLGVTTGAFNQRIDTFTFSLTARNAFCWTPSICFNAGDTLLRSTTGQPILNSRIQGTIGGTTGSFVGSSLGGSTISYDSPLLTFAPSTNYGFTFGLSAVNGAFANTNVATSLASFRARIQGDLQSDPPPSFNVPEPGTWAMMIAGMGMVGFARRRRRTVAAA